MRNGYRAPSPAGKALCRGYRFPHPTSAPSGHLLPMEGGNDHASPFPWKGLPSAARRGWLPFLRPSRLLFAFPLGEGGPRQRLSGAFVNGVLETISLALFHPAFPIQAPPLRGTSFHRKEGVSTRAPSLGRGCRAQRGGVGFLFGGQAAFSLPSPCRESGVILVPSSTTSIALTRASQRGTGSILCLFDRHAFSGGNPLHSFSNVLPHRRRGQDRPARGIPLCGYSL